MSAFQRCILISSCAAFLVGLLAVVPSIYSILLFERALPAQATDSVIVLTICAVLLVGAQLAISAVATDYIAQSWRAAVEGNAVSQTQMADVQAISLIMANGLAWHALGLLSVPVLALFLYLIHPVLLVLAVGSCLVLYGARVWRLDLLTNAVATLTPLLALASAAYMVALGTLSMGSLVAASWLMARVILPVAVVVRNAPQLRAAWLSYSRIAPTLDGFKPHPERANESKVHETKVVGGCLFVLATFAAALLIPAPSVTIMPGVATPVGHAVAIKAAVTTRVAALPVNEGGSVVKGQIMAVLDADETTRQRDSLLAQIELERAALADSERQRKERTDLLTKRMDAITEAVAKRLTPVSAQIEASLAANADRQEGAERAYQRRLSLLRLSSQLAEADRQIAATVIRAPEAGRVQQIMAGPPGSPIATGDGVLTFVPQAETLIEARLDPTDRSRVHEAQPVTVRVKTSTTRFGATLEGVISTISADRYDDGQFRIVVRTRDPVPPGSEVEVIARGETQTAAQWVGSVVASAAVRTIR